MWAMRLQTLVASGSGSALSPPKVLPSTLTSAATTGLNREALMAMTLFLHIPFVSAVVLAEITLRRAWSRLTSPRPLQAPPQAKLPPPTRPTILQSTEFTVVRDLAHPPGVPVRAFVRSFVSVEIHFGIKRDYYRRQDCQARLDCAQHGQKVGCRASYV